MEKRKRITIQLSNIHKTYLSKNGNVEVLRNFSCTISNSHFYSFLGPSGYGKTTILNLIAGIEKPNSGTVVIQEATHSAHMIDRKPKIGYVFQEDRLLPWKTVYENLDIILQRAQPSKRKRSALIKKYLHITRLDLKAQKYPSELSGGEKQRVSIIRALCIDPDVVLMDEPFSHLDEMTAISLRSQITSMWEQAKIMTILVTHNIFEAVYLSDKIFIIPEKPIDQVIEIPIHISRPRNSISYEEFMFLPQVRKIVLKIRKLLPNA